MLNFNDPVAQKDGTIKPLSEGSGGGGGSEYSTEEKIVGKWVDGRPLYQKTLISNDTNSNVSIPINIDEEILLISFEGMFDKGDILPLNVYIDSASRAYAFYDSNNKVIVSNIGTWARNKTIITIKYVKGN